MMSSSAAVVAIITAPTGTPIAKNNSIVSQTDIPIKDNEVNHLYI